MITEACKLVDDRSDGVHARAGEAPECLEVGSSKKIEDSSCRLTDVVLCVVTQVDDGVEYVEPKVDVFNKDVIGVRGEDLFHKTKEKTTVMRGVADDLGFCHVVTDQQGQIVKDPLLPREETRERHIGNKKDNKKNVVFDGLLSHLWRVFDDTVSRKRAHRPGA